MIVEICVDKIEHHLSPLYAALQRNNHTTTKRTRQSKSNDVNWYRIRLLDIRRSAGKSRTFAACAGF